MTGIRFSQYNTQNGKLLTTPNTHQQAPVSQVDTKIIVADIKNTLCSKAGNEHMGQSLSSITFDYKDGTLRLAFPHDILKTWFLEKQAGTLNTIIRQHPSITGIEYTVRSAPPIKSL